MESKLAIAARRAVIADSQRLSPEARLEAFLVHSRLMAELHRAGKQHRANVSKKRR